MGKTVYLRQLLNQSERALVYDPLGNFTQGVICIDQFSLKSYLERNINGRFRVIYRPPIDMLDRRSGIGAERVDWLCMVARWVAPVELYFDELSQIADVDEIPDQLFGLVRYGRNISVTIRGAVQRPRVVIPRHYLTETTRLSIFQMIDPLDRSYVADYSGIPEDQISSLKPLECMEWTDIGVTRFFLTIPNDRNRLISDTKLDAPIQGKVKYDSEKPRDTGFGIAPGLGTL